MKVNVTYSVDLEEVPRSVSSIVTMIAEDCEYTQMLLVELRQELKQNNINRCFEKIEDLRKNLLKHDDALLDCNTILKGYHQTTMNIRSPEVDGGKNE